MKKISTVFTKINLTISIIGLFINLSVAQETNNWYFGSAAGFANTGLRVSFNTGSPVVTTGYPMLTEEGSSSISNASGTPLFYTDGVSIWDASTNVTFGTGLAGGASSTQSAIIMPKPGAVNQWLVFTSGTQGNPGVTYYTVSGTLGAFSISAGTTLVAAGIPGEGLCIVGNSVTAGAFWVVSRDDGATGQVRSFAVDNAGVVNATAILSTLSGPSFSNTSYTSEIGTIKSNTCQNKLAFTYLNGAVDLVNFDASTGMVVTNTARRIAVTSTGGNSGSYGIEFSTNDLYLYISNLSSGQVYRHDIVANTTAVFGNVAAGNEAGQLQAAPDGNIYMANRNASPATAPNYLSKIDNPGAVGATFTAQSVLLSGVTFGGNFGFVYRGLPTFPKSLVVSSLTVSPGDGAYCVGASIPLSFLFSGSVVAATINWSATGGGETFTPGGTTSNSATPSVSFSTTGVKVVTLTFDDNCSRSYTRTMTFTITAPKTPAGTITCTSSGFTLDNPAVDADEPNYIWYKNSVATGNIIGIGTPVTYVAGSNTSMPANICLGVSSGIATSTTGTNKTIAVFSIPSGGGGSTPATSPTINVLANQIVLKSFNISFRFAGNYTFTVTILDGLSNTIYSNIITTGAVPARPTGAGYVVPVNTTLPMGTGYTINITAASPIELGRGGWTGATNAGELAYNAIGIPGTNNIFTLLYDHTNFTATPVCSTPTCYPVSCVLPVRLLYISGKNVDSKNILTWATASETSNDYFEIRRSTDGIDFVTIGKVKGNGNSNSIYEYEFIDNNPTPGTNYYQYIQHDYNNELSFSPIISVTNISDLANFSISPNPSTESFTLNLVDLNGSELTLFDLLGRILATYSINAGENSIEIGAELSKGAYIVKLSGRNGVESQLIIKE